MPDNPNGGEMQMVQWMTSTVSALAFLMSVITVYLTLFRRGTVHMTRPTIVFFGPDGRSGSERHATKKVFLRTLLYATSKRGRIIENMFVKLRRDNLSQNFNIWVYGDQPLARGSGLFVGENGVAYNHHFLLAPACGDFQFHAGTYHLEVFASLVGDKAVRKLISIELQLSDEFGRRLEDPRAGLYFDWEPDLLQYHPHIDLKLDHEIPPEFIEAITAMRSRQNGFDEQPILPSR
jgi:hypothetical protein